MSELKIRANNEWIDPCKKEVYFRHLATGQWVKIKHGDHIRLDGEWVPIECAEPCGQLYSFFHPYLPEIVTSEHLIDFGNSLGGVEIHINARYSICKAEVYKDENKIAETDWLTHSDINKDYIEQELDQDFIESPFAILSFYKGTSNGIYRLKVLRVSGDTVNRDSSHISYRPFCIGQLTPLSTVNIKVENNLNYPGIDVTTAMSYSLPTLNTHSILEFLSPSETRENIKIPVASNSSIQFYPLWTTPPSAVKDRAFPFSIRLLNENNEVLDYDTYSALPSPYTLPRTYNLVAGTSYTMEVFYRMIYSYKYVFNNQWSPGATGKLSYREYEVQLDSRTGIVYIELDTYIGGVQNPPLKVEGYYNGNKVISTNTYIGDNRTQYPGIFIGNLGYSILKFNKNSSLINILKLEVSSTENLRFSARVTDPGVSYNEGKLTISQASNVDVDVALTFADSSRYDGIVNPGNQTVEINVKTGTCEIYIYPPKNPVTFGSYRAILKEDGNVIQNRLSNQLDPISISQHLQYNRNYELVIGPPSI